MGTNINMRRWGKVGSYILLIVLMVFFLFPIYWMVMTSFKGRGEILIPTPHYYPHEGTFASWGEAWEKDFFPFVPNSLMIGLASTGIVMIVGTLAAYAFERLRFGGRDTLAFWTLTLRMAPPIAIAIPVFMLMKGFRLLDTHLALILMYSMFNLPVAVWLMRGFIREIPEDIENAAQVDGYSRWRTFWTVLIPLIAPSFLVVGVICFIFAWNEFLFALILTRIRASTLPIAIASRDAVHGIDWDRLCVDATIAVIPVIVLYSLIQKYLVRGLTFGAVKG